MMGMRVAFFGGTFDPIHCGHLRIAEAAANAFHLDSVLFAPVGAQPLKPEGTSASFADRAEMVRLAVVDERKACGEERFALSMLDAPLADGRPNYTVDTLERLAAEHPGAELFVLTGADSFLDLRRWRSPDRLLAMAEWIVVSRPDFSLTEADLSRVVATPQTRARVHLLTDLHEDISATGLRRRLGAGESCAGLLTPAVAAYIQSHSLYR
jgi:nicotinate-nucleotide adenylyltransferase